VFNIGLSSVLSCLQDPGLYSFFFSQFDLAHVLGLGVFRYEYLWEDGIKFKRPTKLPAPEYVDALMNWAQHLLDDETTFPNKIGTFWSTGHGDAQSCSSPGVPFPRNFRETVKTIVRRLFRVYAHIYSNHFDHICALGIEGEVLISSETVGGLTHAAQLI